MIQKNIKFPPNIGKNITLVAKSRRMQLSELHEEILSLWLDATPMLPVSVCVDTSDRISVYLSENIVERLLQRLVDMKRGQSPSKLTETDLIRSALIWWLHSLALDTPLTFQTTLDE